MEHPIFKVKLALQQARQRGHRLAIHLACGPEEGYRAAEYLLSCLLDQDTLMDTPFVCQSFPNGTTEEGYFQGYERVTRASIQTLLGRDTPLVIFDGFCGFNPNLMSAACGTICGGGIFLLLAPPTDLWPNFHDPEYSSFTDLESERTKLKPRFLTRLQQCFTASQQLVTIQSSEVLAYQTKVNPFIVSRMEAALALTAEQHEAVPQLQTHEQQALVKKLLECNTTIQVVTADRGRGKSAALGLYIAQLVKDQTAHQTPLHIVITAARKEMVKILYAHLATALTDTQFITDLTVEQPSLLQLGSVSIRYEACVKLTSFSLEQPIDILIADEAATIPFEILHQWIQPRTPIATKLNDESSGNSLPSTSPPPHIILATTTDGYEGTGNSFQTRLITLLKQLPLTWKQFTLNLPIRWQPDDPLEQLVNTALMLKPRLATQMKSALKLNELSIKSFDADDPLPNTVEALQALLTLAHYRTTPSDFRQLLDGAGNHVIFYITQPLESKPHRWLPPQEGVIGMVWAVEEGPLDATISQAIMEHRRRLKGHLIPQTFLLYETHTLPDTIKSMIAKHYLRIVRIAVHPFYQSQGVGSRLVEHLLGYASEHQYAAVGTSFSDHGELCRFWDGCGFETYRLGEKKSTITGKASRLMIRWL